MASSGARYQVIVLKVKRNNDGATKELIELIDYFRKKGERFEVVGTFYGRQTNLLPRITTYFLDKKFISNPLKTLYDINKMFIDKHELNFFQASALGFITGIEELGKALKGGKIGGNI